MKKMESTGKFIKRKISDWASPVYKALVYPFIKIGLERKYDSILCKNVYLRAGSSLKGRNYIGDNTQLSNVQIGYSTYISRDCKMSNTRIGSYSCIGATQTLIGNHPVKGENISIYPAFYSTAKQYGYTNVDRDTFTENKYIDPDKNIQISIGSDVWIGFGVSIVAGVTIGDGAVVGSNSIVLTDIEPYAIYAGCPAKKIGMRFDDETIKKLLALKWWDKDLKWIEENAKDFCNPGEFLQKFC